MHLCVAILENGRHLEFSIYQSDRLKDLQEVLEPDEMHMMAILISDVVLTVKLGIRRAIQNGGGNSPR